MKGQILFSGKNKKNIASLSSAEFAHRAIMVKIFDIKYLKGYLLKQRTHKRKKIGGLIIKFLHIQQ